MLKRLLPSLFAIALSIQGALAQGAAQPANTFLATPLSTTGFLGLRTIGLADISSLLTFSNLSGAAICSQLPALTGAVTTTAGTCATSMATLPVSGGGTGQTTFTANLPLIGAGTSAIAQGTRSGNTTVFGTVGSALVSGQCLQADSSGNIVPAGGPCTISGGGGTVSSGAINDLAYYASAGTAVTGLATTNNGILATGATGIPAISTTLPFTLPVTTGGTGGTTFGAGLPLFGAGTSPITVGSLSGNTTELMSFTGAATAARCLHTDVNGNATIAAADCAASGSGTVNTGTINQLAYYAAGGTAVSGETLLQCLNFPALTGDLTSVAGACATTLPVVNANVGSFGGANSIPSLTVNAKGQVTAASAVTPSIPFTELTGTATCSQVPLLTGDITTSATCVSTLATVNASVGSFGGTNAVPNFTVDAKGRITAAGTNVPAVPFSELTGSLACGQKPAGTGDVTSPAGSCANTLATVNVNTGAFGSSTAIPTITLNGKGLATAASTNAVIAPAATLSGTTINSGVTASSLTSFGASPTLASPTVTGALNAPGLVTNSDLANPATTVNGQTCTLGSTCTITSSSPNILEHGGRLTLVSAGPVMVGNTASATTLYYAPYTSPFVAIYNGSVVVNTQFTSGATDAVGLSLATFGTGWSASSTYDVFVTLNAGSPVLCTGPTWTDQNTRTAAGSLGTYDGQYTNNNASSMTCRTSNSATISVPQYQATYVGTIATDAAGKLEWTPQHSVCTNTSCGPAFLYVYNYYNRRIAYSYVFDNTVFPGLSYSSTTIRTAGADINNRIYYVVGQVEDTCTGYYQAFDTIVSAGGHTISGFWQNAVNNSGATQQYLSNSPIFEDSASTGQFSGVSTSLFNAACFPVGLDYEEALENSDGVTTSGGNRFGFFGQQVLEFSYPM